MNEKPLIFIFITFVIEFIVLFDKDERKIVENFFEFLLSFLKRIPSMTFDERDWRPSYSVGKI